MGSVVYLFAYIGLHSTKPILGACQLASDARLAASQLVALRA